MNMNSAMVRIKLYRRALALGNDKPSSQTRKERFLVCDVQGEMLMVDHGFLFYQARLWQSSLPWICCFGSGKGWRWWVFLVASSTKMRFQQRRVLYPSRRAELVMMGWPGRACLHLLWSLRHSRELLWEGRVEMHHGRLKRLSQMIWFAKMHITVISPR